MSALFILSLFLDYQLPRAKLLSIVSETIGSEAFRAAIFVVLSFVESSDNLNNRKTLRRCSISKLKITSRQFFFILVTFSADLRDSGR